MQPELHRCHHPRCSRWAGYGHHACDVHAGLGVPASDPLAAWPASAPPPEPFALAGPFDLVVALRDNLHRYLSLHAGPRLPRLAEDLRLMRTLSLTTAELAPAQAGTSATDEIDAFLAMVCRDIVENPSEDTEP